MDLQAVIFPPLEIRNVIDKTSVFVAKNGLIFEERIYERERHNPKFSFLNPNDPYHKYYQLKTEDLKNGTDRVSQLIPKETVTSQTTDFSTGTAISPKEPAPFEFRLPHPPISPLDLDLMKCTALYVARNGRQFLSMLSIKEQKNVQFDFLKPSNILFAYFNKLVEMYTRIMQAPASLSQKLSSCCDKFSLLDSLMGRVEYEAWSNIQRQQEEAKRAQEQKNLTSLLIWQEFIVVENLSVPSTDDIASFELPITLNDLKALSLKDKAAAFNSGLEDFGSEKLPSNPEHLQVATANISERKIKKTPIAQASVEKEEEKKEKCPVCKKTFLASEIAAHIKQELAASSSANSAAAVQPESVQFDFISSNLNNFMSQATRKEQSEDRTSTVEQERVIWDGTSDSANMVARAAQIQTNQIYQNLATQPVPYQPSHGVVQSDSSQDLSTAFPPSFLVCPMPPPFLEEFPSPNPNLAICPPAPSLQQPLPSPNPNLAICPLGPSLEQPFPSPNPNLAICPPGPSLEQPFPSETFPPLPIQPTVPPFPKVFPTVGDFSQVSPPTNFTDSRPVVPFYPDHAQMEDRLENESKKQKSLEDVLIPAAQFISMHPDPLTLNIQLPDAASSSDKPEWNFNGKIIQLKCTPQESINELKIKIQNITKIPVARQKLFAPNLPPLKNQMSIAYYNLLSDTCLALHLKERGGRK